MHITCVRSAPAELAKSEKREYWREGAFGDRRAESCVQRIASSNLTGRFV